MLKNAMALGCLATLVACGGKSTPTPSPSATETAAPTATETATQTDPADRCSSGDAAECFSIASEAAEQANRELSMPTGEDDSVGEAAKTKAREFLELACEKGHECACAAQATGDCNSADKCSVKDGDACVLACSEEPSCLSEAFFLVRDS